MARLHLPSNSVAVDQGTSAQFERDVYQRLLITPQTDLSLDDKTNLIREGAQAYTSQFYKLIDGGLSRADTVLTPVVEISAILNRERKVGADVEFKFGARIEFFLD